MRRNLLVHTNMLLVRADTAEEAYQRAMELGAEVESAYQNPEGRQVHPRFRSVEELHKRFPHLEPDGDGQLE